MANQPGRLEVVATPIGNMGDLSDRVREALACSLNVPAVITLSRLGARGAFYSLRQW